MNSDLIARYYDDGIYSEADLAVFVAAGYLTEEQKQKIISGRKENE